MAINRKLKTGIHKVRDVVATADGKVTRTEVWHGPYELLNAKQETVYRSATSTNLTPNGATSTLTITYETPAPTTAEFSGSETLTEVIWREIRMPIAQHPQFKDLKAEKIQKVQQDLRDGLFNIYDNAWMGELRDYILQGITEYSVGAPVVRRTKTKGSGRVGGGKAWYKNNPPVRVPGDWNWVKTADERRRDGNTYTQVEEWTGFNDLASNLYK